MSAYDCYFLIADYQVADYAGDLPRVRNAVWEVALDWLAAGPDPEGDSFVIESLVPEHAELTTWLAWFLPVGMLERNPPLKAGMEAIEDPADATEIGKSIPRRVRSRRCAVAGAEGALRAQGV